MGSRQTVRDQCADLQSAKCEVGLRTAWEAVAAAECMGDVTRDRLLAASGCMLPF